MSHKHSPPEGVSFLGVGVGVGSNFFFFLQLLNKGGILTKLYSKYRLETKIQVNLIEGG